MLIEESPCTCITIADTAEVQWIKGITEREISIFFTCEKAFLAGKLYHILRKHHVLLVFHVEACDTALVGMGTDAVVWNANCHPCSTRTSRAFTHHFHDPNLVFVGNRKGLAFAAIAVLGHKVSHNLDGLTGCGGTLKAYINQRTIVDDARCINQFLTSAKSGLADADLVFVHLTDDVISHGCLRNLTKILIRIPVVNLAHLAWRMLAAYVTIHIAIHAVAVGIVTHDYTTIGRCSLGHNEVGAGKGIDN